MHQAFFHPFFEHMHFWDDKQYKNKHIDNVLDEPTKKMWAAIDDKHFMHKEDEDASTFHHYVLRKANNDPEEVFEVFHPNAKGHGIWAEHMVNYITENKLCITI
jgi:lysophospholipase L1-like esterase